MLLMIVTACSAAGTAEGQSPAAEITEAAPAEEQSPAVVSTNPPPAAQEGSPAADPAGGLPTFSIVPEESEARFIIGEILSGAPKTVIGTTSDVEGRLTPDFDTPSNTTVGTIRVDLSTLRTDNSFRNLAIHGTILETGNEAFRYAEFTPTALSGLPDRVVIGQTVEFQITGNLTIHGVTREVTFDVTATPVSETRLEGLASLEIRYADFNISILRLPPQVASVEEQVILELEFVAVAG
jgi:polyisoprenoid-binding protein YceI